MGAELATSYYDAERVSSSEACGASSSTSAYDASLQRSPRADLTCLVRTAAPGGRPYDEIRDVHRA